MKLLIVTQVIDTEHPILGFFHRWVEEFSKHCEQVHVICLQAGKHSLPANVTVHSLGKEEGKGRLTYLWRFYKLIWSLRHEYENVFVHMNQEYVLLAGMFWKAVNKKIFMWRNHNAGSFLTKIAALFCSKIYYTSSFSYTARFKRSIQMPIGIDTNLFSPQLLKRKKNSLLYVGRIASIKKVDVLIDTMCKLRQMRPEMFLTIVGSATNTAENEYKEKLEKSVHELKLPVIFTGPVTWRELPRIYSEHELCINLTPPGAFDKVIGEALACECDIVTANLDLREILNHRILESVSSESLADFLHKYQYHEDEVRMIRKVVIHEHSLTSLVQKVLSTTC